VNFFVQKADLSDIFIQTLADSEIPNIFMLLMFSTNHCLSEELMIYKTANEFGICNIPKNQINLGKCYQSSLRLE
jgi:hypothetical protein